MGRGLLALALCFALVSAYMPVPAAAAPQDEVSVTLPKPPKQERPPLENPPSDGQQGPLTPPEVRVPRTTSVIPPGAPIVVDTFVEYGGDTDPGDDICANVPSGGWCTLRAAIMEANARAGADTIILPAGTYTLALLGSGEDGAATGDLDITDTVTIIGSGGNADADRTATIIQAQSVPGTSFDRVFHVNPGGSGAASATFKALTIRYGGVPGSSSTGSGGGIEFETLDGLESLTLYNVVVDQNRTAGTGTAGGIDLFNGSSTTAASVLIDKSVISGNSTTQANGGAITAENINLTIRDSAITGNTANHPTGTSLGGGLYLAGSIATATIERSLFATNKVNATGDGGALYSTVANITVKNTTFSGNWAGSDGGAIHFGGSTKSLSLTNVTMTGNTASNGNGGGVNITAGTVTMHNSIVYGNTALVSANIFGSLNAASSYNMVGSGGTGGLTNGTNGNKVGVNPLLSPLGNWGGPTQSHKLLVGSPAMDAGTNSFYVAGDKDQRGFERKLDAADSDATSTVDIGAVEAHPTLSDIGNQTSPATVAKAVPFYVGDANQGVTITATSSNQVVVPDGNLVVTNGTTYNPTLTITGSSVGTATITVTASGGGDTMTDTFVMTVTAPPKAGNSSVTGATTNEDTQSTSGLVVTPNAADSSTVTHFKITGITNGRLYKNNGTTEITNGSFITKAEGAAGLKFTPAADYNGTGSFQVQAAYDAAGTGLSDPVTASVTVNAVNDNPVAGPDTVAATMEDFPEMQITADLLANDLPGPVTATDEAGQTLSITGATAGNGGTVRFAGGSIYFTPAPNFFGNATFTYTVQDSGGKSATGTVTVPVTPQADPPVVLSWPTTLEDTQTASGIVIDRSPIDGAEVTHLQITGITNGKLYQSNGLTEIADGSFITVSEGNAGLKFTPAPDFNGTATFMVAASTSNSVAGLSDTTTAFVTVYAVNDAPTGADDTLADVAEDSGPWTIPFAALTGNDSAGPANESSQTLTVAAAGSATGGTVALSGNNVIFTPAPEYNGAASFTYTVQDGGDGTNTATATVHFTITTVNDAPTGTDDTLSAVDEDSAPLRIPFFALLANDSAGPADENGQTLTITALGSPVGGTVAIDGTDVLFTLDANFQGVASFTYTVADNGTTDGAPDSQTATVTVTFPVNGVAEAPGVTAATTAEDTMSSTGLVITPDAADGAAVTHYVITGITGGTLYKHDGTTQIVNGDSITAAEGAAGLKFLPVPDRNTPAGDTFGFTVQAALDAAGTGLSGGTTVSITVTERNDAPTGVDDTPPGAIPEDYGTLTFNGADLLANDSQGPANESGQTLSITAADNAVGGTVRVEGGNVVFTTAANFYGTASFRYTVSDNGTTNGAAAPKSSTATVSFTITPAPDAPQITDASTAEDSQSAAGLVVTPNALDGAEISHFVVTNISGGRLYRPNGTTELFVNDQITRAEGAAGLKFTPDADANGTGFSISLAAVDQSRSLTGPASTAWITVTEVNDAPTGVDDNPPGAIPEDYGTLTFNGADLLANDSQGPANESGQTLSITAADNAVGGTVTVVGGNVIFTPAADFYGTASFRYTLTDNGTTAGAADARTSTATVTFTVTPVADAPQITATTTPEDIQSTSGLVITRNAVDGAEVTHFEITGITGGTLYLSDGTTPLANGDFITAAQAGAGLKFTPAANANTPAGDTFTFTAKAALDGSGAAISGGTTASITVTEVNDAPTGVNDTLTAVAEDAAPVTIAAAALTANDLKGPAIENGQALTITAVTAGTGGTVVIDGTDLVFTPAPDFYGTATFTYTVQDNGTTNGAAAPKTSTATVSIPVTPVADTPSITATTTAEETQSTAGLVITRNAADGAEVTHFEITGITGGTLYLNDGSTAIANGQSITAAQAGAGLKFTPAADANTPAGDTFTFTVKAALDGSGAQISGGTTASITVTEVNDAPAGVADTLSDVAEDSGPWTIPFAALTANDVSGPADENGQARTVVAVGGAVGGTVAISGTDVIFTPNANFNGTASFRYTVADNGTTNGAADPRTAAAPTTVTFTVTPVNDAPVGADDVLTPVAEDSAPRTIAFADLLANDQNGPADENGQTLTITAADNAVGGTVTVVGGNVIFTPADDFYGTASFRYTLTDNGTTAGAADARTSTATVTFAVTPVADAPQITATTTPEDTQSTSGLVITRNAADGAEVTHFEITGITGGTLYLNDGTTPLANGDFITAAQAGAGLKFTPAANANTPAGDTFGFTARAALDGSGTAISGGTTAAITVTEVNDSPTAVADTLATVVEDSGPWTIPFAALTANDVSGPADESGQARTISSVSNAVGGAVAISGTDVIFTPTEHFNGTAGFTYTLTDDGTTNGAADPQSHTAAATFTVTAVNDAPIGTADTLADVAEDSGPWTIPFAALTGNDSTGPANEGAQTLAVVAVTDAVGGTVAIAGTDVLFTPALNFHGTAGFTYTLQDNGTTNGASDSLTATAAVRFTVTPVNDAPVAQDGALELRSGESAKGSVTATDVDGDTLTYTVVDRPIRGTVTMNANGTYVYRANSAGTDTFTYRANDGTADSNLATVTITTHPSNAQVLTISVPTTETRESSILVSGTANPGLYVAVNGTLVLADAQGHWSITVSLVEGPNLITATMASLSRSVTVVRDTTPPVLTFTASAEQTDAETVVLTATSEAGARITIEGQETSEGQATGTLTVALQMGMNRFSATATDRAGNQSTATVSVIRVGNVPQSKYTDIAQHWSKATVERLADLKVVSIYPEPLFQPEERVTRLEFAVMVARVLGLTPVTEAPAFTDLAAIPEWARPEVAAAVKAGIIKGLPDGSFAPNNLVTRAEMAVMLTRALAYAGKDTTPGSKHFSDGAQIPTWAMDQVLTASRYGLITGYPDNSFQPARTTTRAEAVTMLARLLDATAK